MSLVTLERAPHLAARPEFGHIQKWIAHLGREDVRGGRGGARTPDLTDVNRAL